jgi:hypothetical protein
MLPSGAYVQVNDHYDLTDGDKLSDGKRVADLVAEKWDQSLKRSEELVDKIMRLASGS